MGEFCCGVFPAGDKKPTGHTCVPAVSLPLPLQMTLELLKMEFNNKWSFLVKILFMTNIEQCCCGRAPTTAGTSPSSQCPATGSPGVTSLSHLWWLWWAARQTPASHG